MKDKIIIWVLAIAGVLLISFVVGSFSARIHHKPIDFYGVLLTALLFALSVAVSTVLPKIWQKIKPRKHD